MRTALCLHGLSTGKNDKGHLVDHSIALSFFRKNVINPHTSVFIHTWTTDGSQIEKDFKPTKSLYQPQEMFDDKPMPIHKHEPWIHSIKSRWTSAYRSVELKKKYELEHKIQFDLVLLARFDLAFLTPFPWKHMQGENFYVAEWHGEKYGGLLDFWFCSGSSTINQFAELISNIDSYIENGVQESNHMLAEEHLKAIGKEETLAHWGSQTRNFSLVRRLNSEKD